MNCRSVFRRAILALGLGLAALPAAASERHFGFSYESPVLQAGQKELETYSDYRFGRDSYYSALDQRLEFEMGLGDGIQTSLYLNFEQEMEDDGTGNITNSFLADGVSNEWKFKVVDSMTEDFGLGLYAENGFKPDEYELETKVILDKQTGGWLWTFNLTNEPEYHYIDKTMGFSIIPSMGAGYFIVPERFFVGAEAQYLNFWYDTSQPITTSILSAGPVLAYSGTDWWTTLTFLPQWVNFLGSGLDLANSQRYQAQWGLSFALDSHPPMGAASLPQPTDKNIPQDGSTDTGERLKKLTRGRDDYLNNCQKCHAIHAPSEFTEEGWNKILAKMGRKALLDDDTFGSILAYVRTYSKGAQ